jgi:circadian clock protein KaiB
MKDSGRTQGPPRRQAAAGPRTVRPQTWHLKLYVAGLSPDMALAMSNLKQVCHTHLAGRYTIKVIDLLEHPKLARGEQILAVPTLVRGLPPPMRKMIGNLSDTHSVLVGLDLIQTARS